MKYSQYKKSDIFINAAENIEPKSTAKIYKRLKRKSNKIARSFIIKKSNHSLVAIQIPSIAISAHNLRCD